MSLWIVLVVALSIDYSLFILSRYSEELKKRVKRYQGHRRRLRSIQVSGGGDDDEEEEDLLHLKEADWFDYALHKHNMDETSVSCIVRALDELYSDGYYAVYMAMTTAEIRLRYQD